MNADRWRDPGEFALTVYIPGTKLGNVYAPDSDSLVNAVAAIPVALFVAMTCAAGIKAPVMSSIVPLIVAYVDWLRADADRTRTTSITTGTIGPPLLSDEG